MEFDILRRDTEARVKKHTNLLSPTEEEHVLRLERYEVTEAKLEREINRFSAHCIETIELYKVTFSDRKCDLLARGIKENEAEREREKERNKAK